MVGNDALRTLPKVDEVLGRPEVVGLGLPRWAARAAVREAIEERRAAILAGGPVLAALSAAEVGARARARMRPSLRPVVNATGVVLHTNLGRAPLGPRAVAAVAEAASRYVNLEFDVGAGERGSRHDHVEGLLVELTGAEAGCVVNNNAAAVLLGLAALGEGREVVVSRGELVEIGGSFRIPDVMRQSGARLVEVGTTNRTRVADYVGAGSDVGLLMKVHRSNFAVVGFTSEASVAEVVEVGRARGVPVMVDLGSGTLCRLGALSSGTLPDEPTVGEVVAAGADVVTFSGDKLLGGPQAGVLVGRRAAIERIARHPLMRALRPDKLTIAALAATLAAYRDGAEAAIAEVPAIAMLTVGAEALRRRAEALATRIGSPRAELTELRSLVGGGALPLAEPVSWGVALTGVSASGLEAALRAGDPPVIARIEGGRVLLDVRTILDDELELVVAAVRRILA